MDGAEFPVPDSDIIFSPQSATRFTLSVGLE
jgi:hypothetical protein